MIGQKGLVDAQSMIYLLEFLGDSLAKSFKTCWPGKIVYYFAHHLHGILAVAQSGVKPERRLARTAVYNSSKIIGDHDAVFARRRVVLPGYLTFYGLYPHGVIGGCGLRGRWACIRLSTWG